MLNVRCVNIFFIQWVFVNKCFSNLYLIYILLWENEETWNKERTGALEPKAAQSLLDKNTPKIDKLFDSLDQTFYM